LGGPLDTNGTDGKGWVSLFVGLSKLNHALERKGVGDYFLISARAKTNFSYPRLGKYFPFCAGRCRLWP
jgi:hypothetical protein